MNSQIRRRAARRGAAATVALVAAVAPIVAYAAESGTSITAPANPTPSYAANSTDLTTGSAEHAFTRNSKIRANVTAKVAGNQSQGVPFAGWPADIYRVDGAIARETIDWTEGVILDAPSTGYAFSNTQGVSMPTITEAAGVVTATGGWQGGTIAATARYEALAEAPIVKIELDLTNTGAAPIENKVFGFVVDPDDTTGGAAFGQTAILPGVGVNPNSAAVRTSGWTSNYTYQGPGAAVLPTDGSPATNPGHGLAWLTDEPSAVYPRNDGSAYSSLWWPVNLAAGASDTITFYYILEAPAAGADVTAGVAGWAAQLATLDPQSPTGPVGGTEDLSVTVDVPEPEPGEFLWTISGAERTIHLTEATNEGTFLRSTGELIPIEVTDTRLAGPAWSVSGRVSDFSNGLAGKYLGWTPEVTTTGAGAVAGDPVASGIETGLGLSQTSLLASATDGHETGTATVGADFDLRIPVDTPAGTYTATLTITALS